MAAKQSTAFITTGEGLCYLTVKCGRWHFHSCPSALGTHFDAMRLLDGQGKNRQGR